jgi:hypothetical protein
MQIVSDAQTFIGGVSGCFTAFSCINLDGQDHEP